MRFTTTITGLLILLGALLLPAGASAQDPVPTDPSQGSPSGTIYEIPVDQGRRDGAPRRGDRRDSGSGSESDSGGSTTSGGSGSSGGSGGAGSTAETTTGAPSPIRSDNGFGTSSIVPGTSGSGGDAKSSDTGRAGASRQDKKDESDADAAKSGEPDIPAGTAVREASVVSSPSLPRAYLLLALGAAVALALAVGARLAARRER